MENSLDNMHIRDPKIEDEVSIEYVITEESLARVRRRLRGKFGVKTLQYVWNFEDVKLSLLILENCVILSHFIIHQRS